MSTYKLYYFNGRGRAEATRILFAQAGVKYEDIRFGKEEWISKYKAESPFGRSPYLEVDGKIVSGSINILRYLGEKFDDANKLLTAGQKRVKNKYKDVTSLGSVSYYNNYLQGMAGKDALGNAILGGASDYLSDIGSHLSKMFGTSDEVKAKLAAEFKEKTVPQMLPVIQKYVKDGHFMGSDGKLSWVDIQGYSLFDSISTMFGVNLADYPELKKLVDGVASQPNIKKWIETRPKTQF